MQVNPGHTFGERQSLMGQINGEMITSRGF